MNTSQRPHTRQADSDEMMPFYVFMMVFWPVSLFLGLIDYVLIPAYDLRPLTLLLGLAAGGAGAWYYKTKHPELDERH